MQRATFFGFLVGAALCLHAAAETRYLRAPDIFLWTFQYQANQVFRVRTHSKVAGTILGQKVSSEVVQSAQDRVVGISATGAATIAETIRSSVTTCDGVTQKDTSAQLPLCVFTRNRKGIVVSETPPKLSDMTALDGVFLMLRETPAPDAAVQLGESWRTHIRNRLVNGEYIESVSKVLGRKRVGDVDALQIRVQMDVPVRPAARPSEIVHIMGVYAVDTVRGRLLTSDYEVTGVPLSSKFSESESAVKVDTVVHSDYDYDGSAPATRPAG